MTHAPILGNGYKRKLRLFSDRLIALALERLREGSPTPQSISDALRTDSFSRCKRLGFMHDWR